MGRLTRVLAGLPLLLALTACGREPEVLPAGETGSAHAQGGTDHAGGAGHANQASLPLRPIMLQLAVHMAGLSQALWVEDYAQMATHSGAIVEHAHISAEELQRIRTTLGAEMAAFEEADERVHVAAVALHEAAQARQLDALLEHLAAVQRGCAACHSRFRERLRTVPGPP